MRDRTGLDWTGLGWAGRAWLGVVRYYGEQGAVLLAESHGGVRGEAERGKAMARLDIPPSEEPRVTWHGRGLERRRAATIK